MRKVATCDGAQPCMVLFPHDGIVIATQNVTFQTIQFLSHRKGRTCMPATLTWAVRASYPPASTLQDNTSLQPLGKQDCRRVRISAAVHGWHGPVISGGQQEAAE